MKLRQKIFFWEIDWSYNNSLTNFEFEKEQLIPLDDVTRIKLALRNQGQLAPFVCYLDFKIGNFAFDVTEII